MLRSISGIILIFQFYISSGQEAPLLLGTVESNYVGWSQSKSNPYIAIAHFQKIGDEWSKADIEATLPKKATFYIGYNGRILSTIQATFDTVIERMASVGNAYKIRSGTVPKIGAKTKTYSGWIDTKMYRPLLISSSRLFKQKNTLLVLKPRPGDNAIIEKYLKDKAQEFALGEFVSQNGPLVTVTEVLKITDEDFLLKANVNVNMYAYSLHIPFADTSNTWTTTEQVNMAAAKRTRGAYFLVHGDNVKYVDYNLTLLDHGDYDNDGSDEIILRVQKYNEDGYILITDEWSKILTKRWNYH